MRGQCTFWMVSSCQSCLKFTASSFMYTGHAFAITHTVFRYSCHNMKLTLVPTKTQSLFIKHFYIVHFPFAPSLFTSGHFSFCFLFSSSSLVALMHSHHPFIHVDVLFIKASIIQPTPRHLRLLRSTSHSITPPPTHGLSLEAYTLPAPLPLSSLLLSPWRSYSYSYFSALLWNLTVQRTNILYTVYIHTAWLWLKLGKVCKMLRVRVQKQKGSFINGSPSINQ